MAEINHLTTFATSSLTIPLTVCHAWSTDTNGHLVWIRINKTYICMYVYHNILNISTLYQNIIMDTKAFNAIRENKIKLFPAKSG